MNHRSKLNNRKVSEYPWLNLHYDRKRARTLNLVTEAVKLLISNNKPVTLSSISITTKELDPEGKGLHPNTIRSNPEAYCVYTENSITYKKNYQLKNRKKPSMKKMENQNFSNIKIDRDLNLVSSRYKKWSKEELINRLIAAEQYIAENNSKWVDKQFENYFNKDTY